MQPVRLAGLLNQLDAAVASRQQQERTRTKVAVIMGGYSSERHISVESGRNIYEKEQMKTPGFTYYSIGR